MVMNPLRLFHVRHQQATREAEVISQSQTPTTKVWGAHRAPDDQFRRSHQAPIKRKEVSSLTDTRTIGDNFPREQIVSRTRPWV